MSTFISDRPTKRLPLLLVSALAGLFAAAGLIAVARPTQAAGATITIEVSQPTLIANNVSTTLVVVTVTRGSSQPPLAGDLITFPLSPITLGTIIPFTTTTTDLSGTALITWTAGTLAGSGQLTVTDGSFAQTANTLTARKVTRITVLVNPATQIANSSATSTIIATAFDVNGSTVPGADLSGYVLPGTMGGVSGLGTTGANGQTSGIWTSGTLIGNGTLYVTNGSITGQAAITLTVGAPYTITLQADLTSLVVGNTSFLRAFVKDRFNNWVADGTVVSFTSSIGNVSPSTDPTSNGIAFSSINSTQAGVATITARSGSALGNATVTFGPDVPATVALQASPTSQVVGNSSVLTATVRDQYGNLVGSGISVNFNTDLGDVVSPGYTTNGIATSSISSTVAGTAHFAATTGSALGNATVTFTPDVPATLVLQASPTSQVVGNSSVLTATVYDQYDNLVGSGIPVAFTTDLGYVVSPRYTTNGIATSYISSTIRGTAHIAAISGSALDNATVTFGPDVPATVALQASPTSLVVGNSSVLTATVRDQYDNLVGSGIPVTFTTDLGNVVSPRNTTNGIATSSISSTVAGTAHITATTTGAAPSSTVVTFTADTPMTITVRVDPPNLTPNSGETAMITATVVDRFYNPVPGRPLTGTLVPPELGSVSSLSLTDDYGRALGTWRAGNIVIRGRLSVTNGTRTGTADIALLQSRPQTVSVQVVSPTLFAKSGMTTTVIATARDAYGNYVPGAGVNFRLSLAPPRLGDVTSSASTDSNGRATATWTATAGSVVTSGLVIADAGSGAIGSAPIKLTADVPYSLTLQADPASPVAGTGSTLMATVSDRLGNLVTDGTGVTFTSDCCTDLPPGSTTDGVALSQINWTEVGPVHVTATSGLATDTTTVNFGPRKVFLPVVMRAFPPIPTGTLIRINSGAANTYQITVTLQVSATVPADYIEWMRFSNDGVGWGNWVTFAPTANWNLDPHNGLKTVYAQFAGHWGGVSAAISDDILLFMNGDFAQPNLASWNRDPGNVLGVSSALQPANPTNPAGLLGNPAYACNNVPVGSGSMSQYLSMPTVAAGQQLVVRFNYHIYTSDRNIGLQYNLDRFDVLLDNNRVFSDMNQDKNKEPQPYPPPPPAACTVYDLGSREAIIPVTGNLGSRINVVFRVYNLPDPYYSTYVYLDNVRLEFQGRSNNQSDGAHALPKTPAEHTGR